jgi:hypothetical protein
MDSQLIVVNGLVTSEGSDVDLRREARAFALDQRAFGPRRLVVAFADASGQLLSMAHARRTDPPEAALGPCIRHIGSGAVVAIAYCDEPVADAPPPPEALERFNVARAITASYGIRLVDWIACDDQLFRSMQLAVDPDGVWWEVP